MRRQTYGYLPSSRRYPSNTAWCQRHTCVNNLPRVALDGAAMGIGSRDLLIAVQ